MAWSYLYAVTKVKKRNLRRVARIIRLVCTKAVPTRIVILRINMNMILEGKLINQLNLFSVIKYEFIL